MVGKVYDVCLFVMYVDGGMVNYCGVVWWLKDINFVKMLGLEILCWKFYCVKGDGIMDYVIGLGW